LDNDEMARRWMLGHGGLRVRGLRGREIFVRRELHFNSRAIFAPNHH
jgi:hypothetical protein